VFGAVDRPDSYFQDKGGEHIFNPPSKTGSGDTTRGAKHELTKK